MADAVILDTSAILTLTGNEPGADEVQIYLIDAIAGRILNQRPDGRILTGEMRK